MRTVKELKNFLNNLPDDTPIIHYSNDMEKRGYLPDAHIDVKNMKVVKRDTYDAFDYTPYSYEAYEITDDKEQGQLCLVIG